MNNWYKKLSYEQKKTCCLLALAGMYYDFYSEDELMEMFNIDKKYIEEFDYDKYMQAIYEYEIFYEENYYV